MRKFKHLSKKSTYIAKLQALGKFTASEIHEIDNRLSVVSGNAKYLLEKLKERNSGNLTEEDLKDIRDCLNITMKCSDDVCAIAKKLLELTRRVKPV